MSQNHDDHAYHKACKHFMRRSFERHAISVSYREITQINNQIKNREAEFLTWSFGKDFRSLYRVVIQENPYIVLFDFKIECVITIFHNSWLKFIDGQWIENGPRFKNNRRYNKEKEIKWKSRTYPQTDKLKKTKYLK